MFLIIYTIILGSILILASLLYIYLGKLGENTDLL